VERFKKTVPPLLAVAVGLFHAYEAATAAMGSQYGRMAWKGVLALMLLGLAHLMNDTGKRFSDS
jgi:hypothetical protein